MPTQEKEATIGGITEAILSSEAVLFTDYRGLTVAQVGDLRRKLKDSDTSFAVVKNTLFKRASEGLIDADPNVDATLNGPTAAIYAHKDPVATSKAVLEYIAMNRNTPLKVKGAVVNGKFFTTAQVTELSMVPPRDVLIAMMLGSFNAPITGLVGTLGGILSSLVTTLSAIMEVRKLAPPLMSGPLAPADDGLVNPLTIKISTTQSQLNVLQNALMNLQKLPIESRLKDAHLRQAEDEGLQSLIHEIENQLDR